MAALPNGALTGSLEDAPARSITLMQRLWLQLWFLLIIKPIVRGLIGVAVMGREHLKHPGPFVIVANHNSHLDAPVLMDLLPWKMLPHVHPVATADYFDVGPIRSFIWRRCMNVLAIRRDKVDRTHNPLKEMMDALDSGESLILFPEGTRGSPEQFSQLRTGIAHLIRKRPETPIIVAYMKNLGYSLPRGDAFLVPMFCDVFIARPRTFEPGRREQIMEQIQGEFARLEKIADRLLGASDAGG